MNLRRFDKETMREARRACFSDELFCIVHYGLSKMQRRGKTELAPVEVWVAATDFSNNLLSLCEIEQQLMYEVDDLTDDCDNETDAFLIMYIACYQLAAMRSRRKNASLIIPRLLPILHDHPLFNELRSIFAQKETERREKGKRVDWDTYAPIVPEVAKKKKEALTGSEVMDEIADITAQTSTECMAYVLSVSSMLNLHHDHCFDKQLQRIEESIRKKNAPQPMTVNGDYVKEKYEIESHNTGSNVFNATVDHPQFASIPNENNITYGKQISYQ